MFEASLRSSGVKSMRSSSESPCRSKGAGQCWKWLGRRQGFAGHRRLRDRPFGDRPDRNASHPVQHVHERLLGHLGQDLPALAIHRHVSQHRRGGQVVVPDAVVHRLEMPHALSCSRVERHDAFGKEVVPGPVAAVVIVGRRARGQVDVAEFLVRAHHGPDVGAAAVLPRLVLPRRGALLAALRNRVEGPQQLAGAGVVPAHVAGHALHRAPAVLHERSDHDDVADDDWR